MTRADRQLPRTSNIYRFAWGFYLVLAIGGALWVGSREGVIPLSLFVAAGGWWIDLLLGLAAGGSLICVWRLLRRYLGSARELEAMIAEALGPLGVPEIAALALLSGFAEELFFRGAVQGAWGPLIATLLFALLHTGPGAAMRLWGVFAVFAGAVFAGLMIWRGNLTAPVVAHALVNLVNLRRMVASESS